MPKVQTYQPFQTSSNGVRVPAQQRASLNTTGAFGEGITQGATQLAGSLDRIQDEDDKNVAKERLKQYREYSRNSLFKNEDSFYNRKGENAYSSRKTVGDELSKYRDELGQDLSNNQRRYFSDLSQQYLERDLGGIDRHSMKERTVWQNQQDEAQLIQAQEDLAIYWNEPEIYSNQIKSINKNMAQRNGWSPEVAELNLNKSLTAAHVSAIENIATQNPRGADVYFQEHKDEISPTLWDDIEGKIKVKTTANDAQSISDTAMSLGSESAARAFIKEQSDDPDVRKAALGLIQSEYAARDREERRVQSDIASEFDLAVSSGVKVDALRATQPEKWALLSPAQRKALDASEDGSIDTDINHYAEVRGLSLQGKTKEAFQKIDEYSDSISLSDQKRLIDLTLKPPKEEANVITDGAAFKATMEEVIGPQPSTSNKGQRERWNIKNNILRSMYQDEIDSWRESNPGKKIIPAEERDKILDRFRIQATRKDTFLSIDFLNPDEEATLNDIPADDLKGIKEALEANGIPVNPQNILDLYISQQ